MSDYKKLMDSVMDFYPNYKRGMGKSELNESEDILVTETKSSNECSTETKVKKEKSDKPNKEKKSPKFIGEVAELPPTTEFEEGTLVRKGQKVFIKQNDIWESLVEGNTTREVVKYAPVGGGCGVSEVKQLISENRKEITKNGKVLLIGDSLGVIHTRKGYKRSVGSMSGVSSFSVFSVSGTGTATLKRYASDNTMTWTAPGDVEGPRTSILYPKTVKLYSGDMKSYLYCSIIPSKLPTTDSSVSQTIVYENTTFYGNVPVMGADQGNLEIMIRAMSENGIEIINRSVGGLTLTSLNEVLDGLLMDSSEQDNLRNVDKVVIQIGTNDLLGNSSDAPEDWMNILSSAITKSKQIGQVIILSPPMPTLNTDTKRLNAWKYWWKPLRETCNKQGVLCIDPWQASFNTSGSPDLGMIPDSAHQSPQLAWNGVPTITNSITQTKLHTYFPKEMDVYDEINNPTGNILSFVSPKGTSGTSATGGIVSSLYTDWIVGRISGTTSTLSASQENLDNLSNPWQKLTMSGASAITEITRCYTDVITSAFSNKILDGKFELKVPANRGLRRIGIRIEALGADGRMGVWENEKQTSQHPSLPNSEYNMVIPIEDFDLTNITVTGLRIGFYLQTEIGATASVYFRRMSICPKS